MAFTLSFDDFLITFFTAGVGSDTLPLKIYAMIKFGVSPEINALSTLMLVATLLFGRDFLQAVQDQRPGLSSAVGGDSVRRAVPGRVDPRRPGGHVCPVDYIHYKYVIFPFWRRFGALGFQLIGKNDTSAAWHYPVDESVVFLTF